MQWDPVWLLCRPLRGYFPVMVGEGPRHSNRQDVGGIVYACDTPSHTNYCGTRMSDSPVRAS
jgi:hypothetical protein